ncbi:MAG: MATE family efflux transporter [Bacteroidales bacterium]|nr:MATE family efflux transporter [Bacteroidales bacterium]
MASATLDKIQELEHKGVGRLLWQYALPAVVSQIIASVYNMADRAFIGHGVGVAAIAGLSITMPVMNIVHAFGSLVGVGASARMSIVLGRKDYRWAENILGNSVLLTFLFGFLFVTSGYLFMDPILEIFGASEETIGYAREYLMIVLPGMFMTTLTFNLTGLIRASGYPIKSMVILGGGALLNMLLDPLFIFGFHWGIAGAAWATTISMSVTGVAAVWHFAKPSSFIRFRRHAWTPRGYIFRNILMIGLSPFLMNVAAAGVVGILNSQLLRYGADLAVGTYGVVNTYANLLVLVILGICQGMQPIAGYNYGAGHNDRLKQVYLLTMKVCVLVGLVGSLISCIMPAYMARLFTRDPALIEMAVPATRFLMVMFPLIGFTITNSNFFQSIDKPWIAIVTSLSRQVIFLVPLSYLVPLAFAQAGGHGLMGVWMACTLSDVAGAALAAMLLYHQRKVFQPGHVPEPPRMVKEAGPKD